MADDETAEHSDPRLRSTLDRSQRDETPPPPSIPLPVIALDTTLEVLYGDDEAGSTDEADPVSPEPAGDALPNQMGRPAHIVAGQERPAAFAADNEAPASIPVIPIGGELAPLLAPTATTPATEQTPLLEADDTPISKQIAGEREDGDEAEPARKTRLLVGASCVAALVLLGGIAFASGRSSDVTTGPSTSATAPPETASPATAAPATSGTSEPGTTMTDPPVTDPCAPAAAAAEGAVAQPVSYGPGPKRPQFDPTTTTTVVISTTTVVIYTTTTRYVPPTTKPPVTTAKPPVTTAKPATTTTFAPTAPTDAPSTTVSTEVPATETTVCGTAPEVSAPPEASAASA